MLAKESSQYSDYDASLLDSDQEPWNAFKVTSTDSLRPSLEEEIMSVPCWRNAAWNHVKQTSTTAPESPERAKRLHSSQTEELEFPETDGTLTHEVLDTPKRVKNGSVTKEVHNDSQY